VWSRSSETTGNGEVVLDIDASLHEIHSENKAGTAAHFKGGFGFHPMYVFADATGECLGVKLRPGDAGANSIADHIEVLDGAIAGLPEDVAAGHGAVTIRAWCDPGACPGARAVVKGQWRTQPA
jgi:hypothetical protein